MTCARCGRGNVAGASACAGCGAPLESEDTDTLPPGPVSDGPDGPATAAPRAQASAPEPPATIAPREKPSSPEDSATIAPRSLTSSPEDSATIAPRSLTSSPEDSATIAPRARTSSPEDSATIAPGAAPPATAPGASGTARLGPGTNLGPRYEILSVLGQGGMGTVYKARDRELDRVVALKVIRPEMASRPEILERFKREILLASQVTHKHVLRIHDLGEAGDVRFISMAYVEGSSLADLLKREAPLHLDRALPLVRQITEALQAAHEAGVVHRDLKPQNVLLDEEGNSYIADFGISRSLDAGGTVTDTGMVLGTVDYMSPEQARGETPDHRSDIFALGVMMYEIVTATLPFRAANALSIIMKRVHEDAPPIRQARPDLPPWLSAVVARAMARDPSERYQSAAEILADLDRQHATAVWGRRLRRRLAGGVAAAAAAALLAAGGFGLARWLRAGPAAGPVASLAVLPFRNGTGDPRYDWVRAGLPDVLHTELQQAALLRLAGDDRIAGVLKSLRLPEDEEVRPAVLTRLASLAGVDNVTTATFLRAGDLFRIEATVVRVGPSSAVPAAPIRVEGRGEESIFSLVDELATRIRSELGVSRRWGESDRRAADLTTENVTALRLYSEGLEQSRSGNHLEAARRLEEATNEDAGFAVAHALLAQTYDRLGYADKAVAAAERAMQGLGGASPLEAARIHAVRASLGNDLAAAEEALRRLTALVPNDPEPLLELAVAQEDRGELTEARGALVRVLALDPAHPEARYTLGRVLVKLGEPDEGLKAFNQALALHVESGNDEGRATVLNGQGNAHLALGWYDEAARNFQESLDIRRAIGDQRGVGVALNNIALVRATQGRSEDAVRSALEALEVRRAIGDRAGVAETHLSLGDIYQEAGRPEEALRSYQESLTIMRETGDESNLPRALSGLGYVNVLLGRYLDAFYFVKEALNKRRKAGSKGDIVRSLIDVGAVEQVQGRYDPALDYYVEGLAMAREIGDTPASVALSANLASLRDEQAEFGTAIQLLGEARSAAEEAGDQAQAATCLTYEGLVRVHVGDLEAARAALGRAEGLAREMDNASLLAEIAAARAELALASGSDALSAARQGLEAAERSKDHRLQIIARLQSARARRSAGELARIADEAASLGLAPLVAPARLALARLHLDAGRAAPAAEEAGRAVEAAAPLRQRDLLLQAHHLAALAARRSDPEAAADHARKALGLLEEIRAGLPDPALAAAYLARPVAAALLKDAGGIGGALTPPP